MGISLNDSWVYEKTSEIFCWSAKVPKYLFPL